MRYQREKQERINQVFEYMVGALEATGITCILFGETAAMHYDINLIPKYVEIVIMSTTVLEEASTMKIILEQSTCFKHTGAWMLTRHVRRVRPLFRTPEGTETLSSSSSPSPPIHYQPHRIMRQQSRWIPMELPLPPVLAVVFDLIEGIQSQLLKSRRNRLRNILRDLARRNLVHVDDNFHRELCGHLERVVRLSPELEVYTSKFVRFCRGESIKLPTGRRGAVADGQVEHADDQDDFETDSASEDGDKAKTVSCPIVVKMEVVSPSSHGVADAETAIKQEDHETSPVSSFNAECAVKKEEDDIIPFPLFHSSNCMVKQEPQDAQDLMPIDSSQRVPTLIKAFDKKRRR
ncbi:unnamed protein product [Cyclocybe aegerita]|uniref:Uncharacterized protein n=1 Tax=Cyclocybe aegerita TaxID=1973307 RepID=A0A8S0XQX7_CYCAE|nr:unnamed protein product [Cyclocybe aegerita]